ncbi:MAG: hypothetical protein B6I20_13040 [Bacteroidetes bacterium 4572_117]|nr:MAG: hypothetical protein B6I20_13040 [Bacteroidetes bacterium 4572_117]
MDTLEILDKIEEIINRDNLNLTENEKGKDDSIKKSPLKEFMNLILSFFLNILKIPFKLVAKYVTTEIIKAVKKDSKLYAFIMGLMGVMFVFFSVLWLFISVAVGIYFYDKGYSIFISVVYSIIFQVISFSMVGTVAFIASKNIKSLKMFKEISELNK